MRSLADDLRARSESELHQLLALRPDALNPVPNDIAQLASQLSTGGSVKLALDGLDRITLSVLQALINISSPGAGVGFDQLEPAEEVAQAIERLWRSGLLWGARPGDAAASFKVMTAALEILTRESSPIATASLVRRPLDSKPILFAKTINVQSGQHALAAVSTVIELCQFLGQHPVAILRSGGIGVRDLATVGTHLGIDEAAAGFWLELAHQAKLVGLRHSESTHLTATTYYDTWRHYELGQMWAHLAIAWMNQSRDLDKLIDVSDRVPVLGQLPQPAWLPAVRTVTLAGLADAPTGEAPEFNELIDHLAELRPRIARNRLARIAAATLREAELLGAVVGGSLTTLGRALIAQPIDRHAVAELAGQEMPALAEEFMAQADLTLVVPGPPSVSLREFLDAVADIESIGGAVVYRVSEASIGRAIAAGWDPEELLNGMRSRSATPLPQPLEYQVTDAARKVGQTSVGSAGSYVSAQDESVINSIATHPQASEFGIVRVAPTVAIAQVDANRLAMLLRSLGISATGTQVFGTSAQAPRAPEVPEDADESVDDLFIAALVNALVKSEAADEAAGKQPIPAAPRELPRMATAATSQVLRAAQQSATPVWIGYADNAGSTSRRLIDVVAIASGAVSAFDHATGRIRTLVLSRITGAQLLEESTV